LLFRLKKGDSLLVLYQLSHMDPEIYEEPTKFKYDRFLNEDGTEKSDFFKNGELVRYYLQPFGGGLT